MADERPKVTVEIDGESKEIELPDGYLPEADVRERYVPKDSVEGLIQDRLKRATKGKYTPDELLEDEDFFERFTKSKADVLREKLGIKGKPDDQQVEALRKQIEEQMVSPLRKQLEQHTTEVERLRKRELDAEVSEAAAAIGVHEDLVELVRVWARDRVMYDEEHGWVVPGEKDNPAIVVGEDGKTVRTKRIADLLNDVKRAGDKKSWFRDEVRPGAGFGGAGKGAPSTKHAEDMSEAEKTAFRQEHGLEAWNRKVAKDYGVIK